MRRMLASPLLVLALALTGCPDPPAPAAPVAPPLPTLVPPLNDAQVGEWVRIGVGKASEVVKVVDASDFQVKVQIIRYVDDEPQSPVFEVWPRNSFGVPADGVIRAIDRDWIDVTGKRYECWRLAVYGRQRQMVYWVSEEIPVHGILKVAALNKGEIDDVNAMRLTGWGTQ